MIKSDILSPEITREITSTTSTEVEITEPGNILLEFPEFPENLKIWPKIKPKRKYIMSYDDVVDFYYLLITKY